MWYRQFLCGLSLILLASASASQTFNAAITERERVDFGTVQPRVEEVRRFVVNDEGSVLAVVDTNFPGDTRDEALVLDGAVLLREGRLMPTGERPGIFLDESLDTAGNVTAVMDTSFGRGLYWNDRVLVRSGDPAVAPGFPPGLVYGQLHFARANDARTVLLEGHVFDGPAFTGFLMSLSLDPTGTVLSEQILLVGGTIPPGLSEPIWGVSSFDLNESGEWITSVILGSHTGETAVLVNGAIVAREGDPSPVAGRNYRRLVGWPVDLNDRGDHAYIAWIEGSFDSDKMIVLDGTKFVQEGDSLPALGGYALQDPWSGVRLTNSKDVFWVATTSDPDTSRNAAFMRNFEPIVQKGVTHVEGAPGTRRRLVTDLRFSSDLTNFAVSPSGRYWAGAVVLDGTTDAVILADFGAAIGISGCSSNPGTLRLVDGLVLAGHTVRLEMDGAPAVGTSGMIFFSRSPAVVGSPCGRALSFGEFLIDPRQLVGRSRLGVFSGAPKSFTLDLPPSTALVDVELFAQGAFFDLTGALPGADVTLTNALKLEIGAP